MRLRQWVPLFFFLTGFVLAAQGHFQPAEGSTAISYTITIDDPASHNMDVEIKIKDLQSALKKAGLLSIGVHESVDIDAQLISFNATNNITHENLTVSNAQFNGSRKDVQVVDANEIIISYTLSQELVEETYIDQNYAILSLYKTLFKPDINEANLSGIELLYNHPAAWEILTTLNESGTDRYELASLNDIIDDDWGPTRGESLIAGLMTTREVDVDGTHIRLAIFNDVFDDGFPITMDRFEAVVKNLWDFYAGYFGGSTSSTPTIALSPFKAGHYYGNNMVAQCYMGWDATQSKAGLTYPWNLTHHMAHAWWINALSADPTAGPSYYMVKEGFNSYFNYLSMDAADLWQERQDAWHWLDPDAGMQMNLSDALYWANFKGYKDTVYGTSDDRPLSGADGYPSIEKAVAFARILDYRIQFESNGQNDLGDFFKFLFTLNDGYVFNPIYLVDADQMLSALNQFTGFDFTAFFNKYVYGVQLLPYEPYRLYELGKQLIDAADYDEALTQLADAYDMALAAGEEGLSEEVNSLMDSVSTTGGSGSSDVDDGGGGGGCFLSNLLPFIGSI